MKDRIIVLGAGPCGLSAAWSLCQDGFPVTVLEKEELVGGLCQTINYLGFRFDLGGHRFISEDPKLVKTISELMKGELLLRNRKSTIRFQGQDFSYPLSLLDLINKLPISLLVRALRDYLRKKPPFYLTKESLEEWLISHYGSTLYNLFFRPYTTKLWGISPAQMAPDWAGERIPPLHLTNLLLKAFKKKNSFRHYASRYFYPKKGIGQIFQEMAHEIACHGGRICLSSLVERLYIEGKRIKAVEIKKDNDREIIELDWLIATIPLPSLVNLICPPLAPSLRELAHQLRYRSLRFLNLLIDSSSISDNTWIYVPDKDFVISRIQEPRNRSPYSTPAGFTSLILEIPCSVGDQIWQADNLSLYQHCMDELKHLGIDLQGKVIDYFFTRVEYAYPIYHLGYQSVRQTLLAAFNTIENILLLGRQARFHYLFMDQAIGQGIDGARQIKEGIKDVPNNP
jgi:protoporphyrinogen oxidase